MIVSVTVNYGLTLLGGCYCMRPCNDKKMRGRKMPAREVPAIICVFIYVIFPLSDRQFALFSYTAVSFSVAQLKGNVDNCVIRNRKTLTPCEHCSASATLLGISRYFMASALAFFHVCIIMSL